MFEISPWYTADFDKGLTLEIESEDPRQDDGWQPPMEAPYLSSTSFDDVNSET